MPNDDLDPLAIAESKPRTRRQRFVDWLSNIPFSELWFWPTVEVIFIAIFSLSPIVTSALWSYLRSKEPKISFYGTIVELIHAGQLIYYALGFVATAAWIVWSDIERPRIARVLLGALILAVVMGVSTTVGLDQKTVWVNETALRTTSYYIFSASLVAYFVALVVKAWQPMINVEDANRRGEGRLYGKLNDGSPG